MDKRRRVVLTSEEIAAALTKNDYNEAEALGDNQLGLTVRPRGSSRTFSVRVHIVSVEEV